MFLSAGSRAYRGGANESEPQRSTKKRPTPQILQEAAVFASREYRPSSVSPSAEPPRVVEAAMHTSRADGLGAKPLDKEELSPQLLLETVVFALSWYVSRAGLKPTLAGSSVGPSVLPQFLVDSAMGTPSVASSGLVSSDARALETQVGNLMCLM